MKKFWEFYNKYKDYGQTDLMMYLAFIVFFAVAVCVFWVDFSEFPITEVT